MRINSLISSNNPFAKAFRAELVPEDPDEPVSVLLEGIRQARGIQAK